MWKTVVFACCLYLVNTVNDVNAQGRVAPGVPPQHYQQQQAPPPQYQQQQQFQQVPQQQQQFHQQQQAPQQQIHQQQVPVQQQQHVPVQQQQQVHYQQAPVQQQQPQGHHHGHHGAQPGQLLNAANIVQEKDHIAEHMEVPIDTSKMTDQELQFHYFKMHDADNNNKLDGCELIKSLIHWHDPASKDSTAVLSDEELVDLVEPIFESIDKDDDGFVDYTEYRKYTE